MFKSIQPLCHRYLLLLSVSLCVFITAACDDEDCDDEDNDICIHNPIPAFGSVVSFGGLGSVVSFGGLVTEDVGLSSDGVPNAGMGLWMQISLSSSSQSSSSQAVVIKTQSDTLNNNSK